MPFILVIIASIYSKKIEKLTASYLKNVIVVWLLVFVLLFIIERMLCTNSFFESIRIAAGLLILGIMATLSFYYLRILGWFN